MNPKWHLIEKILRGEKTIESRWYKNKISPWDKIQKGDIVYFKDAGKLVTAKATVSHVIQTEIIQLSDATNLINQYQKDLCFTQDSLFNTSWLEGKRYVILIFLTKPETVEPFTINKTGYGSACAWISIQNINAIKH
ncbi:hypothetical protein CO112_02170 [Candidatus Dojkabacteria bacterium CG_4_9_14_3_um_filter_150_Dojkabacteria_WS6_41_13]|uniref:ASCH domain-containing protein n=1 Tax=Candidatus Dojkabacteria bacterium CG_4_10_14_0_2_um_filter_Dojkabacteria_WS6_41_15 TaxID=2014249 RepID=A0A2M7W2V8_9BACT|nr:MAG: hypothetical protein COZ14_04295 [Candidatus Dojkabacteria bacterium CG_4_10_14_3_um_filter_Dojkabacteria_WS6_41_9]PJA15403.1 MAG: hypothetical protein COX64_00825 [Candidatus Dojkabacteria bacterium CG_4_10_14_0_2_um_filter_Dojkabacteria_WS6_41_15]PJB22854.1 MAG: hypothetical protein CO112_02170 [Candidatus Dojkabacteria bacterium CG_4_9_14_3_um_filter_150_Dojkabacteria_WS6_41_13]